MRYRIPATVTTCSLLALAPSVFADGPPAEEWTRLWNPENGADALGGLLVVAPGGDVYVAALTEHLANQDIVLLKYDASGELEWVDVYDGVGGGNDSPTDIELTAEGVSVVGASPGRDGPQTVLLDYSDRGDILGERRTIGPSFPGFLRPQLAIGADGRRVVATDDNEGTMVIEAYAADGTQIFAHTLSHEGFGGVSALGLGDDLSAFLVTVENTPTGAYVVRKYDADGVLQWTHVEADNTGLVLSEAFAVPQPDGGVVVTGSPEVPCVTVKSRVWRLDAKGSVVWSHDLPLEGCDFGMAVGLAGGPDGATYLAATATPASYLARFEPNGDIAWVEHYGGDGFNTGFRGIDVTDDGRIILSATEAPSDDIVAFDIRVLCFDDAGELGFTTVFAGEGGGTDFAGAVSANAESAAIGGTTRTPDNTLMSAVTLNFRFVLCAADLDGSGDVGVPDLVTLIGAWGKNFGHPADLDGDGFVGVPDLVELLVQWGEC